ncbi:uroporphyrinogen-III synthase [Ancylomarina longa]|uniref:Uroporphyrinogen-III synthase n=1 Tax=Ancylomarina longa TaxID=2487017 RepID=A0A434AWN6_9BACT|nr:uroporphyrinogen-III synthase [Ancylomarina longa]RUT78817.1 uroporphyrinogen-III synthase [Ancylomarina longa]
MRIKTILVSQPKPQTEKSPYFDLAEKYNLKIDFRPFIQVEGISAKDFRQERINILEHTAVIFTSRTAIDHFFRICQDLRIVVPDEMKYFCISESTAFYLQKYIVYRKRKIFFGEKRFEDLMEIIVKHKGEKYLIPLSDIHKQSIPAQLDKNKIKYSKAILYRTVSSDLSDLADVNYDILAFYSPSGITSLLQNFPEFKQNSTIIAAFGPTTSKAVSDAKLRLDIQAPMPQAPSMTMALDQFIKKFNKENKDK